MAPEQEGWEATADGIAHDLVSPPDDYGDANDGGEALTRVSLAYGAAYRCLAAGGAFEDASAAAAESLADYDRAAAP